MPCLLSQTDKNKEHASGFAKIEILLNQFVQYA